EPHVYHLQLHSFPTRRSSDLPALPVEGVAVAVVGWVAKDAYVIVFCEPAVLKVVWDVAPYEIAADSIPRRTLGPHHPGMQTQNRSEEHTSELQSRFDLVCRLL